MGMVEGPAGTGAAAGDGGDGVAGRMRAVLAGKDDGAEPVHGALWDQSPGGMLM